MTLHAQKRLLICCMLAVLTSVEGTVVHGDGPKNSTPALTNEQTPAMRPNVILCMADDQGWGDVGYYGPTPLKTPTMDEMAHSGLRFDRFYAAAPVCSPTRGSVLTGRHPNRFGCFSWGNTLRPQEVTLAEVLKTAGYTTGHFGKWHLGPVRAESPVCPGQSGFDEWFSSPNFFENNPWMSRRGKAVKTTGEGSQVTVDAALDFIRGAASKRQPFLAVIWFGSPHLPHEALEADRQLYADHPPELQNYFGEITAMDRALGNLRKELRTLGIADDTLLWYTSDNGALKPGSTGGLSGNKGTLWEGGIRVPGLLEWPSRIKSPRIVEMPCGSVDIYPTILDLVGAKAAEQPPLDGISLRPLIEGAMTERTRPLGFWVYPSPGRGVNSSTILSALAKEQAGEAVAAPPEEDPSLIRQTYSETDLPGAAAWIDGRYKLHRNAAKSGPANYKLYDLIGDREEKQDLAANEPARVEQMKEALNGWQRSVVRSLNGDDYRSGGTKREVN